MYKIEYIYRELLYQSLEKDSYQFTTTELANKFKMSLSTVHHALVPLIRLKIVEVNKRISSVHDVNRLLYFWATKRNLDKDIVYTTYSDKSVYEIESLFPVSSLPTAYSACRMYLKKTPADYDKIYFYCKDIQEVKRRFPENNKKTHNIFILQPDNQLFSYKKTPLGQLFVDLWNLSDWYAKEYIDMIQTIINKQIGV